MPFSRSRTSLRSRAVRRKRVWARTFNQVTSAPAATAFTALTRNFMQVAEGRPIGVTVARVRGEVAVHLEADTTAVPLGSRWGAMVGIKVAARDAGADLGTPQDWHEDWLFLGAQMRVRRQVTGDDEMIRFDLDLKGMRKLEEVGDDLFITYICGIPSLDGTAVGWTGQLATTYVNLNTLLLLL